MKTGIVLHSVTGLVSLKEPESRIGKVALKYEDGIQTQSSRVHAQGACGGDRVVLVALTFLLVPALRRASQKSKILDCNNNLKQIGIAYRI